MCLSMWNPCLGQNDEAKPSSTLARHRLIDTKISYEFIDVVSGLMAIQSQKWQYADADKTTHIKLFPTFVLHLLLL